MEKKRKGGDEGDGLEGNKWGYRGVTYTINFLCRSVVQY